MEEALVPYNQSAPGETGVAVQEGAGFENYTLTLTGMQLVQPTSQVEGGVPGTFREALTGSTFKQLSVVPLKFGYSRGYFEGGELGSPICYSIDGVLPSQNAVAPQAETCEACHRSKWRKVPGSRKDAPPDCAKKPRLTFVEKETQLPYYITLSRASNKNYDNLYKAILNLYFAAKARGQVLNMYNFCFDMIPERVVGGKGNYYIVKFTNLRRVEDTTAFGGLYQAFVLNQKKYEDVIDAEVVRQQEQQFETPESL